MASDYEHRAETVLGSRVIRQIWPQLTPADIVQIAIRLVWWEMKNERVHDFAVMRQIAEEQVRKRAQDEAMGRQR